MQKIGFNWLAHKLSIKGYSLSHESYLGTVNKIEISSKGTVIQTFNSKYALKSNDTLSHLEFGFKYDDLNLAFIKEVFDSINNNEIEDFVRSKPNGKYSRIIGYLYEFTTGKTINIEVSTSNYIDLIDTDKYITGDHRKISKWKVNDNLLGTHRFCPTVRKTTELSELLEWNIADSIKNLREEYTPEIFSRASYFLYKKESKSSSEIEKELPSPDRMDKFIAVMEQAGQQPFEKSLSETELVKIQNAIVDPRYIDNTFRDFQNYIGQTLRDQTQKVHYVCPPPQIVPSLMQGITELEAKNKGTSTIIKATMVSFGFVYVHPFEDGNGRIHRYLIHDTMVRDGVIPSSTILPVSAQILARITHYDDVLESVSKLIERKADFDLNDAGEMRVNNPHAIEALYRFPDLTDHVIFLAKAIQSTVTNDLPEELLFLKRYEELRSEIQSIVDMPHLKLEKMIAFLHQNKGKLAKRKRTSFAELEDHEIEQMQESYRVVFEL